MLPFTASSFRHFTSPKPNFPNKTSNEMNPSQISLTLFFLFFFFSSSWALSVPMNCTDTNRICTSFLTFHPNNTTNTTLPLLLSMFDINPDDITVESPNLDTIFIKKNCSCDPKLRLYLTSTTYTVRGNGDLGFVDEIVEMEYGGLGFLGGMRRGKRKGRVGEVVGVRLICGCSSGLWNYLVSYVMEDGDSVESLASRFGVSMDSIEEVNGIADPRNFSVGSLYFVPLDSVPGEPYPVLSSSPPAPAPTTSPDNTTTEVEFNHKAHLPYAWILGIAGVVLGLLVITLVVFISLRSSVCSTQERRGHAKSPDGRGNHKFQILRSASSCCTSGREICHRSSDVKQPSRDINNEQMNIPKVIGSDAFELEKPVVFTYDEIVNATEGFSEANLLGHGTYGSVYYGLLRDQEVAIKRMTATKSKEFTVEMKVLCRVHHANLVELIGYAASSDELFVIYEYAQKGSLRSHLHDPQNKGQTSLSWIMRVQIALDAARGLEYIHEHTKTHYVHRDIKTSNILLDGAFRAKISDFGLSKLVGKASEADVSATRVVGTYGYLAPEYLSEGLATTKSDVYAFGVVLFELISGREAVIRTEGLTKNSERRSLVSIILAAMRNVPDSMCMDNMKGYIDPNLMDLYPHDCVFKVAVLAKQCADPDPILRPDMKQLVISLSQILLSSVEWEATLAGNSQVFSGLVQGR